jgi:hypothetical protein
MRYFYLVCAVRLLPTNVDNTKHIFCKKFCTKLTFFLHLKSNVQQAPPLVEHYKNLYLKFQKSIF